MLDNIKIKYINLDRRPDRNEKFINEMNNANINEFERFSAVDGSKLSLTDDIEKMFKNNTFNWRKGIMGVALSHTAIWKELVEETNESIDYYLIFEDDVWLENDFKEVLTDISKTIKKIKYPFVFLGYHTPKEKLKLSYDLEKDYDNNPFIYPIVQKTHIWGGLFGYLIHKECAKEFLNNINNNGLKIPIDTFVLQYRQLFMAYPEVVKSQFMTFDNKVDSDIQYELTGLKDNYTFIPGKDSIGGDIGIVNTHSFEILKNVADMKKKCVAFNTFGYLKHTLTDSSDFINLKDMSGLHGLYVKKLIN